MNIFISYWNVIMDFVYHIKVWVLVAADIDNHGSQFFPFFFLQDFVVYSILFLCALVLNGIYLDRALLSANFSGKNYTINIFFGVLNVPQKFDPWWLVTRVRNEHLIWRKRIQVRPAESWRAYWRSLSEAAV